MLRDLVAGNVLPLLYPITIDLEAIVAPLPVDVLLAFYDYPAEHWIHLRTTNPIESTMQQG